jgi:hypothetical protein
MMHHALGKQKKHDHHGNYNQEPYNVEPRWLSSCRGRRIQMSCHQSCASSVGATTEAGTIIQTERGITASDWEVVNHALVVGT